MQQTRKTSIETYANDGSLTTFCAAMLVMILLTSCSLQAASAPSSLDQNASACCAAKQEALMSTTSVYSHRNPRRNLHRSQRRNRKRFPLSWMSDTQTYTAADNDDDTGQDDAVDQRHVPVCQYGADVPRPGIPFTTRIKSISGKMQRVLPVTKRHAYCDCGWKSRSIAGL